jgi:competence protein ComEC
MPPSQFFVTCAISFLAGILLASFGPGAWWPWPVSLAVAAGSGLGLGLILVLAELAQPRRDRHHKFLVVSAAALFFCAGVLRFELARQPSQFTELLNQKGEWEGVVVTDADIRLASRQVTVRLDGFKQNILVVTDADKDVMYGDRVLLTGTLTEAEQFADSDFNYGEFLKRYNVYALMRRPKLIVLYRHHGNPAKAVLFAAKNFLVNRINRYVAEPQASLLIGILIGARKTLPDEIVQQFNRTGLSHIVAVSGYNISIIIVSLGFVARYAGRKAGFFISLSIIIGFVVMTGGSSSIVRAGIMGSLLLVATQVGRPYAVTPSLLLSAALMVAINPRILFWDKGFQLSFTATAGIVYILPYLESLFERVPSSLELKSILLTTFAASWFTWPLLVEGFGRVSLVAPVANLAVLPLVPWLMLFGFCVLLPGLGSGFAFLSNLMLLYILKTLGYLSSLPWASKDIDGSGGVFLAALGFSVGAYMLLRAMVRRRKITADMAKFGLGRLS